MYKMPTIRPSGLSDRPSDSRVALARAAGTENFQELGHDRLWRGNEIFRRLPAGVVQRRIYPRLHHTLL